jgi:hypothetical protein
LFSLGVMNVIVVIGAALVPVVLCLSLVWLVIFLVARYVTRKALPIVIIATLVSGAVPLICFGLVSLVPFDSPAETILTPLFLIWWAVSFPGQLVFTARGFGTLVFIEAFWVVVGGLAAVVIVYLRRRRRQHATQTPN